MASRRRTNFPGLPQPAVKELIGLQDDAASDLKTLRDEAIGSTTDTKVANYAARFNERIRSLPPAAGCAVTFPGATSKTQNRWIEILKLGGGTLTVVPTSGQVQGAATLALTTAGFYYFQSDGVSGWWIQPIGGGGGGETLAATLALGNTTGGVDLNFTGGSEMQSAGDPGAVGEIWTSQGPGASPIWAPAGGGGALTLLTTEVNLGSRPTYSGSFTIVGAGMTIGKPVLIQQAAGPYTGKGTLADEAEDQVAVTGSVTSAVLITAYWNAVATPLVGNVKFNYAVSA